MCRAHVCVTHTTSLSCSGSVTVLASVVALTRRLASTSYSLFRLVIVTPGMTFSSRGVTSCSTPVGWGVSGVVDSGSSSHTTLVDLLGKIPHTTFRNFFDTSLMLSTHTGSLLVINMFTVQEGSGNVNILHPVDNTSITVYHTWVVERTHVRHFGVSTMMTIEEWWGSSCHRCSIQGAFHMHYCFSSEVWW